MRDADSDFMLILRQSLLMVNSYIERQAERTKFQETLLRANLEIAACIEEEYELPPKAIRKLRKMEIKIHSINTQ